LGAATLSPRMILMAVKTGGTVELPLVPDNPPQ
jgi:hypothetical protein